MRRRRVSGLLLDKAVASVRKAIGAFNAMDDDGRQTTVLLHLQHSAEMLLKAGLSEKRVKLTDPDTGRSVGFGKCLALSREHLGVTEEEAGTLRTIDALRDDEQHWLGDLGEELLYLHVRAGVQVLDAILERVFGERLADHLPGRALPITTKPLDDFDVLIDNQYSQVKDLLKKGKRKSPEARALIRGLLALEGHVAEDSRVSERDVDRVVKAVRRGEKLEAVFPRLRTFGAETSGTGPVVTVHFTKKDGAPVTYVAADDPTQAAAVRQIDLRNKFHWAATDLAAKTGLTGPKATALRRHLGIDDDKGCRYVFEFGKAKHVRYSDNALTRMREALDGGIDMEEVWKQHGTGGRRKKAG